jgi:hypothetical protein
MKMPIWTREKLQGLSLPQLQQLRANALRLSQEQVVADCDQELAGRVKPTRVVTKRSPKTSETDVVVGYHFVCQADHGVQFNQDGTFSSGSWAVSERNVQNSIKYGAYLALHTAKSEPSYRQGRVVGYQKTTRSMVDSKIEEGIEFRVQPEDTPYAWVGGGSGEKGYKWEKLVSKGSGTSQENGI